MEKKIATKNKVKTRIVWDGDMDENSDDDMTATWRKKARFWEAECHMMEEELRKNNEMVDKLRIKIMALEIKLQAYEEN